MKLDPIDKKLIEKALESFSKSRVLKSERLATVGCALMTSKGNIFTGICIDLDCGIGFCAEHSASAEMVKNGETQIKKIVAIYPDGNVIPPCGRCRELVFELNKKNVLCEVIINNKEKLTLKELLPHNWQDQL